MKNNAKVVVLGGGTGSYMLLSAMKEAFSDISAVVNMSDNGGSTGLLRDELGVLPPGDVRQCLVALSDRRDVMRDLFTYRYDEGSLSGHSFGNLFLSTLEKTTGSFKQGIEVAQQMLNVQGKVLPVTYEDITLVYKSPQGEVIRGEFNIAYAEFQDGERPKLTIDPEQAAINPDAEKAISDADLVVVAPGNLYGSLIPVLLPRGVAKALQKTKAKKVYIANLITQAGQTAGYSVQDFADELERFGGDFIDIVLYNETEASAELLKRYKEQHAEPTSLDQTDKESHGSYELIGGDFIASEIAETNDTTNVPRSFIRHDGKKLVQTLQQLLKSQN